MRRHVHTRSTCTLVLLAAVRGCAHSPTGPGATPDTALAQVITSDLARFWAAYDAGGKDGAAGEFQTRYLNAASPGLADFIAKRNVTAASLAQMVSAFPRYFVSIRASNVALADNTVAAKIRANYTTIKSLYPAATFPPVTLLIGRFSTGGTTANSGLLIGYDGRHGISRWLYNQGTSSATPQRPGDLGYFIGYRIVQAYYAQQTDKAAALRDIIGIRNADDFLPRSGHLP